MKPGRKIAMGLFTMAGLITLLFAVVYLYRMEFMPYHAAALGKSWSQVDKNSQVLLLALMKAVGGGYLSVAFSIAFLTFIPFRRGEPWANWAILIIGSAAALCSLWATLLVRLNTPASPPYVTAFAVFLLVAVGFILGLASRD